MNRRPNFIQEILAHFESPDQAVRALRNAVQTQPLNARLDLQVLLNALGREEESFAVSNELLQVAPEDPRALFNHGWHQLKRGRLQEGLSFLEYGRPLKTYGNERISSSQPLWTPQTGRGHRVLLVLEGGFGDEMIHVRFGKDLVDLYDCKVVLICHPKLAKLFGHLPWVSAIAQREAALGIYHDSWLPGMSAALALGYEYNDIHGEPYLFSPLSDVKRWRSLLPKNERRLKIGVRWSGNPDFEHQQLRVFPSDLLLDLAQNPAVQLYSFQRDHDLVDLDESIVDLGPHLQNWEDTAAALMNMDLVITSCTSVAHLSAALGRPTWVVVPALPYFIWAMPGSTSPWYSSVRLFRQNQAQCWDNVRAELHSEFSLWADRELKSRESKTHTHPSP